MVLQGLAQDFLSNYLGWPLIRIQQKLHPGKRDLAPHYAEGLAFRKHAAGWPAERKEQWILERLRFIVRRAAEGTAYYRDLFNGVGLDPRSNFTFEDFSKIPPLTREHVLGAGEAMISRSVRRERLLRDSSGGSTGEPVQIWLGPEDLGWHLSSHRFFMDKLGVPAGSRIAYLWGHHLDPGAKKTLLQTALSFARNERWFDCFRLSPDILAEYHREMNEFQPDCIVAYASALAVFAQFLEQQGIKPTYPRKLIVTGAEKLFPSQRAISERVFPTPVHERYGGRDAGLMGYQLHIPGSEEFVIDWPNLLVEPESDNHARANILVTKLHADGMPMLRYRVGDVGVFPMGARPGHPVFSLQSVLGRTVDRVWMPNGNFIHGAQFPHLLKDFPVREFMVIQEADYSVTIQVVATTAFSEDHRNSILNTVRQNLPGLPLSLQMVDTIVKTKANKWKPVTTHVVREGLG
jgi:phenylacetate-CoA ligase